MFCGRVPHFLIQSKGAEGELGTEAPQSTVGSESVANIAKLTLENLSSTPSALCGLEKYAQFLTANRDQVIPPLPIKSVIASTSLLERVHKGCEGEWISFKGELIKARYESEYKLVRIYIGPKKHVVNVKLSDDGKNVTGIQGYPEITRQTVDALMQSGIFVTDFLSSLPVTEQSISCLQTHDVGTLPSIAEYSGTDSNTTVVGQGQAHVLNLASSSAEGLYTCGAGPCLILIAVAKTTSGEVKQIALAHLDGYVKERALGTFFEAFASSQVEVSLLAGNRNLVTLALDAACRAGATIVFSHAGHAPADRYRAAVDRTGVIFFGNRLSLSQQIETSSIYNRIRKGAMDKGRLPEDEQLPISYS